MLLISYRVLDLSCWLTDSRQLHQAMPARSEGR